MNSFPSSQIFFCMKSRFSLEPYRCMKLFLASITVKQTLETWFRLMLINKHGTRARSHSLQKNLLDSKNPFNKVPSFWMSTSRCCWGCNRILSRPKPKNNDSFSSITLTHLITRRHRNSHRAFVFHHCDWAEWLCCVGKTTNWLQQTLYLSYIIIVLFINYESPATMNRQHGVFRLWIAQDSSVIAHIENRKKAFDKTPFSHYFIGHHQWMYCVV